MQFHHNDDDAFEIQINKKIIALKIISFFPMSTQIEII
jgi:hypothetical protein